MSFDIREKIEHTIIQSYPYGSVVYGTKSKQSDMDAIIVVECDGELNYDVRNWGCDFTVYSESSFIKKIDEHHISVLECIFQFKSDPYREYFKLDTEKLRRSISSVSSNSFVKCKKKLSEGEIYIGKKSMFHSIRILGKGIQIAKFGEINDYSWANHFLDELFSMGDEWEPIKDRFQPIFNSLKSEFRILAPLNDEK